MDCPNVVESEKDAFYLNYFLIKIRKLFFCQISIIISNINTNARRIKMYQSTTKKKIIESKTFFSFRIVLIKNEKLFFLKTGLRIKKSLNNILINLSKNFKCKLDGLGLLSFFIL